MNKFSKTAFIRRMVAIGLTVLTLIFLFWPSMMGITNEDVREEYEDSIPYIRRQLRELRNSKDEAIDEFSSVMSDADAKAFYNAYAASLESSTLTNWSFLAGRTRTSSTTTVARLAEKYDLSAFDSETKEQFDTWSIYSALMNILFFGMLAMGVLAIVLYALNKSRAAGVLLAVLAAIGSIVFISYINYQNNQFSDSLSGYSSSSASKMRNPYGVGPAMFLLPIFALAACIVYKRDTRISGAFPKASSVPKPGASGDLWGMSSEPTPVSVPPKTGTSGTPQVSAAPRSGLKMSSNWSRPGDGTIGSASGGASKPISRVSLNGWICPQCESDNPNSEEFCPLCGGKKPPVSVDAPRCTTCGAPLNPGASFCTNCGAKQL